MSTKNEQEALQSIVQKAWKDPVFKQNLIANPKQTIESFLGRSMNIPEGKNIAVVDQSNPATIFINIPAEPDMDDMELNEDQLDIVAGGVGQADPPPVILIISNSNGDLFGGN